MNFRCAKSCVLTILAVFCGIPALCAQTDVDGAVRLNNGMILSGVCATTNNIDPYPQSQNLELRRIDQGFRRYYVSTRVSEQPVPDLTAVPVVSFSIPQRRTERAAMTAGIGVPKFSRFDPHGRATVELRLTDGTIETIQIGITSINAQYATVIGLTHDWTFAIATSSIPEDMLYPGILSNAKGFEDGGTRLNMVQALVEAGKFYAAQRLLDNVKADFPDLRKQVADLTQRITEHGSDRILQELKLRRDVGQPKLSARSARLYDEQQLIPEARVAVRQLIEENEHQLGRLMAVQTALSDAVAALPDDMLRAQAREMLTAADRETDLNVLPRFSPFELLAGAEGVTAESQVALAMSGWLLGPDNALQSFPEAYGLFQIRALMQDYCRTADDEQDRRNELIGRMRSLEGFSVERVAHLIRQMPPLESIQPDFTGEFSPGVFAFSESPDVAGCLGMVPPEYSQNRGYPLVISLPREGLTSADTLTWWKAQAERNGFVVVVPELFPPTTPTYDGSAESHRRMLGLIRRIKHAVRIDDERVFIAGHGIGAEAAADIATAHPDQFAGVISIAGLGRRHLPWAVHNSTDLAWYVVIGDSQQFWFDRMGPLLRKLFLRSTSGRQIVDALLVRYPGRGFESFYEESPRIFEWMQVHRRVLYPQELKGVSLLRTTDRSWYWLEVDQIADELVSLDDPHTADDKPEATADINAWLTNNNGIQIRTLPGTGSVKLSADLPGIDVSQSITVVSGGRRQRIDFRPSLRDLLDEYRSTGDRQRLCFMKVPVGR